jgi:hypothetical protein
MFTGVLLFLLGGFVGFFICAQTMSPKLRDTDKKKFKDAIEKAYTELDGKINRQYAVIYNHLELLDNKTTHLSKEVVMLKKEREERDANS